MHTFSLFPLQFVGHMFVVVNMLLQIGGCVMILIRKYVTIAVGMLFGIIVLQVVSIYLYIPWDYYRHMILKFLLQTVTYTVLWDARFFMR